MKKYFFTALPVFCLVVSVLLAGAAGTGGTVWGLAENGAGGPVTWPAVLALFLATAVWHELGHAAALRRGGYPPGGIGAVRAARRALEKAGLPPDAVDHVNAHATSTPEGDRAELQAIRTILGEHAPRVAVTANKSMLGHTLGAAGAIEAVATVMALRTGTIPPTINLEDPDEAGAGLDLTPDTAARRDLRVALSNSFGFGGQNTALVFTRWDG